MGSWLRDRRNRGSETRLPEAVQRLLREEPRQLLTPERLPWLPTGNARPILLVPTADYHLAEIVPLAEELNRRGIETQIAVGDSPWERTWRGLSSFSELEVFELPDPADVEKGVSAVVTMKDTGSMSNWVTEVRATGVPVIGKVEGAQDFWDADTPEARRPYRNLDLVLCQGQFDADALADRETAIVGSSRLERLWWAPPTIPPEEPLALINLNFVYGVRTSDRRLWLETAIEGCDLAGIPYVVSVHPAEKSKLGPHMTRVSASSLLPHSSVLISRFSTMPLEAMAMGVPFIYHNPHGEMVKTFLKPHRSFATTDKPTKLRTAIIDLISERLTFDRRSSSFFTEFVSIESEQTSGERAAERVGIFMALQDRSL